MSKPLKVFITYAHTDSAAKDKLITRLAVMKSEGLIDIWHDNEITGGDTWREEIFSTHLPDSDMLLYLVSADSLDSENCNKELAIALKENIRSIPIILEDCDWLNHQLSDFQAFPDKGLPINEWQPESKGWQSVVKGIRKAIATMQSQTDPLSGISKEELLSDSVFQQGNVLMMFGQLDSAIGAYSRAIELDPRHVTAYKNRGAAYDIKGEHDKAIEDYTIAIQLKPNSAIVYCNRGIAYGNKGEVDNAIADFSTAIELKSNYASAYYNRGVVYNKKGEIDRVIADFSTAIELNPNDAKTYFQRGIVYGKKGDADLAVRDFSRVIKLNSDDADAYYNRGVTYHSKGEHNLATENFSKAIDLNPKFTDAYYNRGNAHRKRGKFNLAIEDFSTTIKLNPESTGAYANRGAAYNEIGEFGKAIEDSNTAIKLNPELAEAYVNRGNAYRGKDEFGKAIEDSNTAIKLNPELAEAYVNRGNAYNEIGELDKSIKDYTKAIKLRPDFADVYYNRGVAFNMKREHGLAIEDYNKATTLNPKFADAYHNRGTSYLIKNEVDKAIEDYNTAIKLNPEFADGYCNRGEAWLRLREWEKAKTDLITAKKMGVDIIALFRNDYKSVEAFEQRHHVKLPEDIALLLTQRRRTRYPKTQKVLDTDGNPLESPNVVNLRAQLRNTGMPLGKYVKAKPAFGINTAPTEMFVVDKATRDKLIAAHPSSVDILKPFLHGQDLRRWHVDTPHQWLIFAHRGIAINDYPAILQHLEKYRESLSKRKGKQEWYELPASLGNVERFAQPKLVCPDTYNHQTFAVERSGYYYGNTSYLIPTEETWLCGLLNSRTVEWFYSQVSNQLTIDYLQARSGYIQQIPIPNLTSTQKALIAKIVDYLIYLQQQPTINSKDLAHARDHIMLGYFERIIDGLVYEAYLPEDLHKGDKHFFQPLLEEQLPSCEEIQGDKMPVLRDIFELLYERTHLVRRDLYYLDSVKAVRIIEGKL